MAIDNKLIEETVNRVPRLEIDVDQLSKQVDTDSQKVNELNHNKADIYYVDNKVYGMANMGQDVKEAMTGGSVAVVGKNSIFSVNVVDGEIVERNTSFINISSKNLFDNRYVSGGVLGEDDLVSPNSAYCYTDYIKVTPGETYTVATGQLKPGCGYDINKAKIGKPYNISSDTKPYTFVVPIDMHYIRHNVPIAELDTFVLCMGNRLIPYEECEYNLNPKIKITNKNINGTSKWSKKNCVTFGDGITWYDKQFYDENTLEHRVEVKGYQSYLEERLGLIIDNQGMRENTTPEICDRIKAFDFRMYDLVTIMCGADDFKNRASEEIGVLKPIGSAFDRTTFIGAYQSMIEHILVRYPEIRVQIFTPFMVWNSGVIMPETYIDAIKSVGDLYGIPVLDLYHNCGINVLTKNLFIVDDIAKVNYQFNPSTVGYNRLSINCIVPFVDNN